MTELRTDNLPPLLLNAEQVAQALGVSKSFAYALMRRGEMPVVRMGRAVRVLWEDLQDFIKDNRDKGQNGSSAW